MPREKDDDAGDLWAKAAELERLFEGYKRRLAERRAAGAVVVADHHPDVDDGGGAEAEEKVVEVGRGRRYEAYVRRRDEKLRQGWRSRMERKEAEMKALWARLDRGRRPDCDGGLAGATPAREVPAKNTSLQRKSRSIEKPTPPVTPRCSPAMKLTRLRSSVPPSPAAAASPRLSNSRALHRDREPPPPTTPRKENRMPPPPTAAAAAAAVATTTPRLKTLSRSRTSLRADNKERGCSSVRESPRPPRFQPPRPSCDSAGDLKPAVLAPPRAANAIAATQSSVLAEIKMAASASSEPFRHRRSGNGVVRTSPPSVILPSQLEACTRLDHISCSDAETISEYSDVDDEGNDDDEIAQFSDRLGDAEVTGDSDTEPSYVYIKKDNAEESVKSSQASARSSGGSDPEPKSGDEKEAGIFAETMEASSSDTNIKEIPVIDVEGPSRGSSASLYSNVRSSFSQRSELDEEQGEEDDVEKSILTPSTTTRSSASVVVQSPMDAVAGLKRFLTFGKKNGRCTEADAAAVVERAPPPAESAADYDSVSEGWLSGDSIKPRLGSSNCASDDLDTSYVISPHVGSLQSFVPPSTENFELKKTGLPAKSPRVHRSFFSFSSFKNRGN